MRLVGFAADAVGAGLIVAGVAVVSGAAGLVVAGCLILWASWAAARKRP